MSCRTVSFSPTAMTAIALALLASAFSEASVFFGDEGVQELAILAMVIPIGLLMARQRMNNKDALAKKVKSIPSCESNTKRHGVSSDDEKQEASSQQDLSSKSLRQSKFSKMFDKIEKCAKSGDMSGAEALFARMRDDGADSSKLSIAAGHVLQSCVQGGSAERAAALFSQLQQSGLEPNIVHFGTLISAFSHAGDVAGAEAWLLRTSEAGIEPNLICYNALLHAYARTGNLEKVSKLIESIRGSGLEVDRITYNTAINAAAAAHDVDAVDQWMGKMRAAGFAPDSYGYGKAIRMRANSGDVQGIDAMLRSMQAEGVQPNGSLVHVILCTHLQAGNVERVVDLQESFFQTSELLPQSYVTASEALMKAGDQHGLQRLLERGESLVAKTGVAAASYGHIAAVAMVAGDIARARNCIKVLTKRGSAEDCSAGYLTLLGHCSRLGEATAARELMEDARKSGVQMSESMYHAMIKLFCKNSDLKAVEAWIQRMFDANLTPDIAACNAVLNLHCRMGSTKKAEAWLIRLWNVGVQLDQSMYSIVLDACVKSATDDDAARASRIAAWVNVSCLRVLESNASLGLIGQLAKLGCIKKAEELVEGFVTNCPDATSRIGVAYNLVIGAHARLGDLQSSEKWMERLIRIGHAKDVVSYSSVIHACARAGEPMRAEHWFTRMVEAQVEPNIICFNAVIDSHAQVGDITKAEHWLQRARDAGLEMSEGTYNTVIHACARAGEVGRAEKWQQQMAVDGIEADIVTYGALINACAQGKDASRAEWWLQESQRVGLKPSVVCYNSVIHAYARVGNVAKAEELFHAAVAAGVEVNVMYYNNLVHACSNGGKAERAQWWFEQMRQAGFAPNSHTYYFLFEACANAGEFSKAKEVIVAMEQKGFPVKVQIFTKLMQNVSWRGKIAEVEECIQMIRSRNIKEDSYLLHARIAAYANSRSTYAPEEVEEAVRSSVRNGAELNQHVFGVLTQALPRKRAEALAQELGGVVEASAGRRMGVRPRDTRHVAPRNCR